MDTPCAWSKHCGIEMHHKNGIQPIAMQKAHWDVNHNSSHRTTERCHISEEMIHAEFILHIVAAEYNVIPANHNKDNQHDSNGHIKSHYDNNNIRQFHRTASQ
jgi:hypothetical protein